MENNLATVSSLSPGNTNDTGCPYLGKTAACKASLSTLIPTANARETFCNNEDYDDCPIFLSKLLRRR